MMVSFTGVRAVVPEEVLGAFAQIPYSTKLWFTVSRLKSQ